MLQCRFCILACSPQPFEVMIGCLSLPFRDDLREHLKNAQKLIMAQRQEVSSSDSDSSNEEESSEEEEEDSSSEEDDDSSSESESSESSEEERKRCVDMYM